MVHSNFERLIDLEGYSPEEETVSHHCSAVVLSRFGNQLEGHRWRRPRYRGEHNPLLALAKLREAQSPPLQVLRPPRSQFARHARDRLKD